MRKTETDLLNKPELTEGRWFGQFGACPLQKGESQEKIKRQAYWILKKHKEWNKSEMWSNEEKSKDN